MNQLPSTTVNNQENLDQMPIMSHLVVLRRHLFRVAIIDEEVGSCSLKGSDSNW
jgi:hypothetical protein